MADKEPNTEPNIEQLRAQAAMLLTQARSYSADIQRALQTLSGDGALHSELSAAAAELSGAISELQIALQSPGFSLRSADLMAIKSIVQSSTITALLSQASAQATSQAAARAVTIAAAETRSETQTIARDLFEKKIFDPYLRFESREEEAAYRTREAEARKYIQAQLARKTPEGDLNAGGGVLGQMLDAHSHGAGNSPDFKPRWDALVEKAQRQRAAMHAAGQQTQEFDRNLNTAVRRFLKAKGLSDAEIEAKLAGGRDPLEAVKPYMGNDQASRELEATTGRVGAASSPEVATVAAAPAAAAPTAVTVDAISTRLKASGVQLSSATPDTGDGHGLPQQARQGGRTTPSLPA